ncbi:hypothetical protein ACFPRL_28885 [Pseudoclavibacter helvolus]
MHAPSFGSLLLADFFSAPELVSALCLPACLLTRPPCLAHTPGSRSW